TLMWLKIATGRVGRTGSAGGAGAGAATSDFGAAIFAAPDAGFDAGGRAGSRAGAPATRAPRGAGGGAGGAGTRVRPPGAGGGAPGGGPGVGAEGGAPGCPGRQMNARVGMPASRPPPAEIASGASPARRARAGGGTAAVPFASGGAALDALSPRGSTTVACGRPATEEAIGVGVGGSVAASAPPPAVGSP